MHPLRCLMRSNQMVVKNVKSEFDSLMVGLRHHSNGPLSNNDWNHLD
jgi:hypothetical protein